MVQGNDLTFVGQHGFAPFLDLRKGSKESENRRKYIRFPKDYMTENNVKWENIKKLIAGNRSDQRLPVVKLLL